MLKRIFRGLVESRQGIQSVTFQTASLMALSAIFAAQFGAVMNMVKAVAIVGLVMVMAVMVRAQTLSTKDGLQISLASDGLLQEVQISRKRFRGVGGFFVAEPQDVPESLRWTSLKGKAERKGNTVVVQAAGLGLELTATFAERPDAIFCEGTIRNLTNSDRAVVLAFTLPLDATNWLWWDNLRALRRIDAKSSTRYAATIRYGTRGEHSPYPFCALNTDDAGIAMGIPLDLPVVHRFVYDAAQKQLRLEWDFGLSPEGGTRDKGHGTGERRPNTAVFKFAIYALDEPKWGMRAAADKFYRLFPDSFRVRVKRFGIWMPFTDIAKIADFEDFGFAYHEGAQNPDFNRKHGFYNFRYEEPWSAWFYLPPDAPTDLTVEQLFAYPNKREQHPSLAEIVKSCGVQDEQGRFSMRVEKTDPVHWAGGQTLYNFLVNADPDIERDGGRGTRDAETKAKAMDRTLREVLADGRLDGIYFDGFGEWVMPNENYRRDHWRVADFPLTFSWRTKQPTQLAAFGIYEYLAHAAEQLHAAGKLVMANGFGYGFPFHAHWVDVGGNEIQWTRQRDDFAFFDYRRVLAYRKPFLPLNNEFFDRVFTAEVAEDYFRWALFYGFPPSCFAPGAGAYGNYWNTPEFHNRDRHLFRRYIPLIVRLCEAGWEPITHALSDNEKVLVERFGRWSEGNLHFTVYNASDQFQNATIAIDAAKLGLRERDLRNLRVWVLTDMKTFPFVARETNISPLTVLLGGTLAPRETALIWLLPNETTAANGLAELAKVHLRRAVSKSQRREKAPAELKEATRRASEIQPKTTADWVQWLARLQELEAAWKQQIDGANIAADFAEASRIVGAAVREMLGLLTDAALPHEVAAGELLRIPVDVRNTGRETLQQAKLIAILGTGDLGLGTGGLGLEGGERQKTNRLGGEGSGTNSGFSAVASLAGSAPVGFGDLSTDSFVPTGGTLWVDGSIEALRCFSCRQYSRGAWQRQSERVSALFANGKGFSQRDDVSPNSRQRLGLHFAKGLCDVGATGCKVGQDAQPLDRLAAEQGTRFAKIALTSPQSPIPSPKVKLDLGDLKPRELRRELLMLKVPEDWANKRANLQVALQATVMGISVTLPIDEVTLKVLQPMEVEVTQFGGEPSILVCIRNNTGESRQAQIKVTSPLEFVERTVTVKARTATEVKLTAVKPPSEMQLVSAKVEVTWDTGQGTRGETERDGGRGALDGMTEWLSLIALPMNGNLLRNGSFEEGDKPPLPSWNFYGAGYKLSDDAIDGKRSILCESDDMQTMRGAMQTVALNQTEPIPLILHGFSKGENVFPANLSGDYSLYLDARYVDGSPLWGEIVPFGGTGDAGRGTGWQWGWRLIVPEKPIREAIVYALFRYRKGRAWFDGVGLTELRLTPNLAKAESNAPEMLSLTDGDFKTVWQGKGESIVPLAVPPTATVRQVAIWWQRPERRAETVQVEIWDGNAWRTIAERPTDADSWLTVVDFTAVKTSRLRVILRGSDYIVREVQVR